MADRARGEPTLAIRATGDEGLRPGGIDRLDLELRQRCRADQRSDVLTSELAIALERLRRDVRRLVLQPAVQKLRHRRLRRLRVAAVGDLRDDPGALDLGLTLRTLETVPLPAPLACLRVGHVDDDGPLAESVRRSSLSCVVLLLLAFEHLGESRKNLRLLVCPLLAVSERVV